MIATGSGWIRAFEDVALKHHKEKILRKLFLRKRERDSFRSVGAAAAGHGPLSTSTSIIHCPR